MLIGQVGGQAFRLPAALAVPGGLLDATTVPKFQSALLIPPVMPRSGRIPRPGGPPIDEYVISVRQLDQQVLPDGMPMTTVWGYGPVATARPNAPRVHNAPSFTIEARHRLPVRVTWVNDLVDEAGHYPAAPAAGRPHAALGEPPWRGRTTGTADPQPSRPPRALTPARSRSSPTSTGRSRVGDESDGYPEAWFLPQADGIPDGLGDGGHVVPLLRRQGGSRGSGSPGSRAAPPPSTPTAAPLRRSGTTTTPSA